MARNRPDELHDDLLELDLTRTVVARPVLELDLESHRQQVELIDVVGFAESGVQLSPAPIILKAPVQPHAAHPELVEGSSVHASTSSARTDVVRTDVALPSMEEFAIAKLAEQYNYKGNLTIGALEDEIVFRIKRSASDALEAGKALIILKEVAGHGDFGKRVQLMGFKERTARNYMRVAETFGKSASNAVLANEIGQYQKMLEMTFFENDELEKLANGGDIDGIDLEQIKSLSAPKLKKLIQDRVNAEKAKVEAENTPLIERIQSLEKQISNHEKHYGELQAKHEVATHTLTKLTASKNPANAFSLQTMAIREEAYALEYGARVYIDALTAKFTDCLNNLDPKDEDNTVRFNAIGIAVGSIYAGIEQLHQYLQDHLGDDCIPALAGKHALTVEERERLDDCKAMIDHEFVVESTGREARRDDKNKRGAGRPAGALNKNK
jgi:hypothetical protein